MKPEIPQSARDALARQSAADEHLSADLLNGFIEQTLNAAEQKLVTAHLAACADCREVVFLAGSAFEADDQLVAASIAEHEPVTAKARSRWASWKWLVPALAGIIVAAGFVVERDLSLGTHPMASRAADRSATAPASRENNLIVDERKPAAPTPPVRSSEGKTASTHKPKSNDGVAQQERVQATQRESAASMSASMVSPASQQPAAPATSVVGGAVSGAAPASPQARSAAKVSESSQKRSSTGTGVIAKAETPALPGLLQSAPSSGNDLTYIPAAHKPLPTPSHWRITDDGQLEHAVSPGAWTRILADQAVLFHAVAVIGNDVWAGGDNGALFHSTDAGEDWTRVALTADGQPETGTIVSIQLDSSLQGSVITNSGTTWTTSDGGKSWSRH